MLVSLTISISQSHLRDESKRDSFWRNVKERGQKVKPEGGFGLSDFDALELEEKIRLKFGDLLAKRVNAVLLRQLDLSRLRPPQNLRSRLFPGSPLPTRPEEFVSISILDISYGSLNLLLDVVGLGPYKEAFETLAPYIIPLMTAFAPRSLAATILEDDGLQDDPYEFSAIAKELGPPVKTEAPKASGRIDPVWLLTNSTLLVPVALALAVLWVTHGAAEKREERAYSSMEALTAARGSLVEQAVKISADQVRETHDALQKFGVLLDGAFARTDAERSTLSAQARSILEVQIKDRDELAKAILQIAADTRHPPTQTAASTTQAGPIK